MTNYEKMRADISKHFKNEVKNLKLEIIRLKEENTNLQVENITLQRKIQDYKNQLESISDGKKALFRINDIVMRIT